MLLDLLGGADPLITNHFGNTARWFDRLVAAGESLYDQTASDVPLHVPSFLPDNSPPIVSPLLREKAPQAGASDIPPLRAGVLQEGRVLGTCAG